MVVAEGAVPAKLHHFGGAEAKVIKEVGALGMADNLDPLPGAELAVNLPPGFLKFFHQGGNFFPRLDLLFARQFAQLLQPLLKLDERFFKLQRGNGLGFGHEKKHYRLGPSEGKRLRLG